MVHTKKEVCPQIRSPSGSEFVWVGSGVKTILCQTVKPNVVEFWLSWGFENLSEDSNELA